MMKLYKFILVILVLVFGPFQSYAAAGAGGAAAVDSDAAFCASIKGKVIGLTTEEKAKGPMGLAAIEGLIHYETVDPSKAPGAVNYKINKIRARDGVDLDAYVYLPVDFLGKNYPVFCVYYGGGSRDYLQLDDDPEGLWRYMASQGNIVVILGEEHWNEFSPACCGEGAPAVHSTRCNHTNYPGKLIDDIEDTLKYFKEVMFWGRPIIGKDTKVISKTQSFGGYSAAMVLASDRATLFDAYHMSAGYFGLEGETRWLYSTGSRRDLFHTHQKERFCDLSHRIFQITSQPNRLFNKEYGPLLGSFNSMEKPPVMPVHIWLGTEDDLCPPGTILAFHKLLQDKGFNVSFSSAPIGHGPQERTEYPSYVAELTSFADAVVKGERMPAGMVPKIDRYADLCMQEMQSVVASIEPDSISGKTMRVLASIGKGTFRREDFDKEVDAFIKSGQFMLPWDIISNTSGDYEYSCPALGLGHSIFGPASKDLDGPLSGLEALMDTVHDKMQGRFPERATAYFETLKACIGKLRALNYMLAEGHRTPEGTLRYFEEQVAQMESPSFKTLDNYLRISKQLKLLIEQDLWQDLCCTENPPHIDPASIFVGADGRVQCAILPGLFCVLKRDIEKGLSMYRKINPMLAEEHRMSEANFERFAAQVVAMEDESFKTLENYTRIVSQLEWRPLLSRLTPAPREVLDISAFRQMRGDFQGIITAVEKKVAEVLEAEFMAHKDVYVPRLVELLHGIYAGLSEEVKIKLRESADHATYLEVAHSGGYAWL